MLATDADLDVAAALPEPADAGQSVAADAPDDENDPLAAARGLAHGMMLGLLCLAISGGALWWAL